MVRSKKNQWGGGHQGTFEYSSSLEGCELRHPSNSFRHGGCIEPALATSENAGGGRIRGISLAACRGMGGETMEQGTGRLLAYFPMAEKSGRG